MRKRLFPALILSGVAVGSAFITSHQTANSEATRLGVGTIPDLSAATAPTDESEIIGESDDETSSDTSSSAASSSSWQENIETLLKPDTNIAERQIVLSDLVNSSDEIQSAVETALRERNIDGLLTPTQKRLQEGTKAVARQITSDIIPGLAAVAAGEKSPSSGRQVRNPVEVLVEDLPTVVPKIGSRVFNALANQAQNNIRNLQDDIQSGDPLRSIERIQKQTEEIQKEAKNIFSETPEGLVGPPYRVVSVAEGYEIREYDGYTVASTSMKKVDDEQFNMDDLASEGEAFNALAAYLFGANDKSEILDMTTPVTTTSSGQMRFYLNKSGDSNFPEPVQENDEIFNEKGKVVVEDVPPATLAVARFTGFVTEGEVTRQKDALLTCLGIDGIEIDVEHGNVVPHVIFQYNPPYTLPVLRRNEIGIPVTLTADDDVVTADKLSDEWAQGIAAEDGNAGAEAGETSEESEPAE